MPELSSEDQAVIQAMLISGKSIGKIRRYLESNGYSPQDVNAILQDFDLEDRREFIARKARNRFIGLFIFLGGGAPFIHYLFFATEGHILLSGTRTHYVFSGILFLVTVVGLFVMVTGENLLSLLENMSNRSGNWDGRDHTID